LEQVDLHGITEAADYLIMEAITFNLKRSLKILRARDRRGLPRFQKKQENGQKYGLFGGGSFRPNGQKPPVFDLKYANNARTVSPTHKPLDCSMVLFIGILLDLRSVILVQVIT